MQISGYRNVPDIAFNISISFELLFLLFVIMFLYTFDVKISKILVFITISEIFKSLN